MTRTLEGLIFIPVTERLYYNEEKDIHITLQNSHGSAFVFNDDCVLHNLSGPALLGEQSEEYIIFNQSLGLNALGKLSLNEYLKDNEMELIEFTDEEVKCLIEHARNKNHQVIHRLKGPLQNELSLLLSASNNIFDAIDLSKRSRFLKHCSVMSFMALASACGTDNQTNNDSTKQMAYESWEKIHPELQSIYSDFFVLGKGRIEKKIILKNLTIEIDLWTKEQFEQNQVQDAKGRVGGVCFSKNEKNGQKKRSVKILDTMLKQARDDSFGWEIKKLEAIVWHELGHCLLERGHAPQASVSIMTPIVPSLDELFANWDDLVFELFNAEQKSLDLDTDRQDTGPEWQKSHGSIIR